MPPEGEHSQNSRHEWILLAGIAVLFVFVVVVSSHYALHARPSDRFRMHALPVAVSQLYLGRPHDYTGFKSVANEFHDRRNDLDALLARYSGPDAPAGEGTYFWTADDRGLADFCTLSFRLFGPQLASLNHLYLLGLGITVVLFVVSFRSPVLWLVPLLTLAAHLFLLRAYQQHGKIPLADGSRWLEDIPLYDSRVFEVLGALPWFHLALLASLRTGAGRVAKFAAIPQAAVLVFLLHARSTVAWEYVALAVVATAVLVQRAWLWWTRAPGAPGAERAACVLGLVAVSVLGLRIYHQATFHSAYAAERGGRTFWHNALIGFAAHPEMRERYKLAIDDDAALQWVIRDTRDRGDVRHNPEWSTKSFMASAQGEESSFDWSVYEACARDLYLRVWRENTGEVLMCHLFYKPKVALGQLTRVIRLTVHPRTLAGWSLLLATTAIVLMAIGAFVRCAEAETGSQRSITLRVAAVFLVCAFVPCIAFYASIATMSGVYLGVVLVAGLGTLALACAVKNLWCLRSGNSVATHSVGGGQNV
jgi:hypothetical protein